MSNGVETIYERVQMDNQQLVMRHADLPKNDPHFIRGVSAGFPLFSMVQ